MVGAPSLTANAALRSGAGLVTIAIPEGIQQTVAGLAPCATTIPLRQNHAGLIAENGKNIRNAIRQADTIAFGPGLGAGKSATDRQWHELLNSCRTKPMVIDADGLNLISRLKPAAFRKLDLSCVMTPHPGEMASLIGRTARQVQANRADAALDCWQQYGGTENLVVVLKGAGTIVTNGKQIYTNRTGNPGMATGGSGDVLTGIIAALIGQGLSLFDAAALGVYVHGLAGDAAAHTIGEHSLIASDLIHFLPAVFRAVTRSGVDA